MKKHTNAFGKSRTITTKTKRSNSTDSQVGESIRAHRLAAGMSQGALARQLGVSFQQVQKYEKGMNRVGAGRLPQIADVFGVPIGALFKGTLNAAPGKGTGGDVPIKLISDTSAVKLLTAFAEIKDPSVRRHLSELVDRIAKSAKKKSRR
jgi:transcriptional regulator with XRE-family HTH domain